MLVLEEGSLLTAEGHGSSWMKAPLWDDFSLGSH